MLDGAPLCATAWRDGDIADNEIADIRRRISRPIGRYRHFELIKDGCGGYGFGWNLCKLGERRLAFVPSIEWRPE